MQNGINENQMNNNNANKFDQFQLFGSYEITIYKNVGGILKPELIWTVYTK